MSEILEFLVDECDIGKKTAKQYVDTLSNLGITTLE